MIKWTILAFIAIMGVGCEEGCDFFSTSDIETPDRYVNFARSFTITPTYDRKTSKLSVRVKLQKGIHAYAAGEKIGRPVKLVITNSGGWIVSHGPSSPMGTKLDIGTLGESVVLEDSFVIVATVVNGNGPIVGELDMQLCSDRVCDRPRAHAIKVETNTK